jgi:hypothetical protein
MTGGNSNCDSRDRQQSSSLLCVHRSWKFHNVRSVSQSVSLFVVVDGPIGTKPLSMKKRIKLIDVCLSVVSFILITLEVHYEEVLQQEY